MTVTRQLCEKIVATTADRVSEAAIAKARQLVLDGVAVAVAGARMHDRQFRSAWIACALVLSCNQHALLLKTR